MMRQFLLALAILAIPSLALAQNQPPVANAGADRHAYTGQTITLHGSATDPDGDAISTWTWEIDQAPAGASWALAPIDTSFPEFTGFAPGDYVVLLMVADSYGLGGVPDFAVIHVADNIPPVAIATADVTTVTVGGTVCFDGSQSYDPEGAPLQFAWGFADGTPVVYGPVALCHAFVSAGDFDVSVRVTDERGANDFDYVRVSVLPPSNHPPVASPSATPNSGDAPLYVQFEAHGSDADGDPLAYAWSFGDGGTSADADPAHTYASPGTFFAWLTVSDGTAAVSASLTIAVSSEVELNVTKLDVDFKSRRSALASVELQAELYAAIPGADDIVAVHIDGAELFAVPFAQFVPVKSHGRVVPGTFKLKRGNLWVQIDFVEGRLAVDAPKTALPHYEPSNGIDVEVMLGDTVAVDNVQPEDEKTTRHYKHHGAERGRGHCND